MIKDIINEHRHTEESKTDSWGDMDCTDTIDFGTGSTDRELTCRVCGFTTGIIKNGSTAVVHRLNSEKGVIEKLT